MSGPVVSIIVPVYKVERFLQKCLDSIISQTYQHLDIILVDDGSPDRCGIICDEYAAKDHRIRVIHKQNEGVAKSRIIGIGYAYGEYVMFVDADDYVDPDIVSRLLNVLIENKADVVCCQNYKVQGNSITTIKRSIGGIFDKEGINQLVQTNVTWDSALNYSGIPLYLWGKLYKKHIISDSLNKGIGMFYGEDAIAFLDALINKTNCLVCLDEPYYYYVHHPYQVSQKHFSVLWPDHIKLWEHLDSICVGEGWSKQLLGRIWGYIKPSIYDNYKKWGGLLKNNKFISTYRELRNSEIVKKYIWDNCNLPKKIKRHPHYIFLKYRLHWLDYMFYFILWLTKS